MADISAAQDIYSTVFTCPSGAVVGNWVYLSGSDAVGIADGGDAAEMPAIGVIVEKLTTTTCIIQYGGELPGQTGLTAGTKYYISALGVLTSTAPAVVQVAGVAKDTTTLIMATPTVLTAGTQSITGDLTVSGTITANTALAVNGSVAIKGDGVNNGIGVTTGNVVNLSVTGVATNVNGTFFVLGDTKLQGTNFGAYNTTPVPQPANSVDARHALVTLGFIATGGNGIPSASPIRLPLMSARNDDYTVITATTGAGLFNLAGTLGSATNLLGEASGNNTKTDKCLFEFVLPPDYIAAANITLSANVQRLVTGATGLSATLQPKVYKMSDAGVAGSDLGPGSATAFTNAGQADVTFTITGTTLNPGDRLIMELTGIAISGAGSTCQIQINSLRLS